MSKNDKVSLVHGNFVLNDKNCVFIWSGTNDRASIKIITKDTVRKGDKFVYCDNCGTGLAVQVDGRYKEKCHYFTLCAKCLHELGN